MTVYVDDYYAREADRIARGPQLYGGNAQVAALRCFQRYHRDRTTDILDLSGRSRWITPKQARVYAILRREAGSSKRLTMTEIAGEAMICVSSVSRAITKFQAWGIFAIDITRGRHGGIKVRLRTFGDSLRHYAQAAWARIRSRINVAFTLNGQPEADYEVDIRSTVSKSATFIEEARIERDAARVLAGEIGIEEVLARSGRLSEADREWQRAEAWAGEVIAERRRLDAEQPDWDDWLDKVRASYGLN